MSGTTSVGGAAKRAISTAPGKRWRSANAENPRIALWAITVGFFVTSIDNTVVYVATPSIMADLGADYHMVIWVTSAYVLAYTVPSLLVSRLGDRFGVKNAYLMGLAIFAAASLWCGLSGSVEMLIAVRVGQGIGAALLYTQTFSIIAQIFPPQRRGEAASVWAAVAGVGILIGPLAGGVLVETLGWQWIFFINVPIGVVGFLLAVRFVPVLPRRLHRFDLIGVGLSGLGLFLIVFALQQGHTAHWSRGILAMIGTGVGLLAAFVYWQSINTREPLIPLKIFGDRNFALASFGVAVIEFVSAAMVLPGVFFMQAVCGLSPARSAILMTPMSIVASLLTPLVGKIVDRSHPRRVAGFGFSVVAIALTWFSVEMTPTTPVWRLALPIATLGAGMIFVWPTLAATATRNVPAHLTGASSGVYNAARALGTVLGSAGIAAFMTTNIAARTRPIVGGMNPLVAHETDHDSLQLPQILREPFAAAMSQSIMLPALVALLGLSAALFMVGFANSAARQPLRQRAPSDIP
ncbi:MFS transporter [Mycobacterium marinum]|uniref:MFS transporter n=1 Tax=Mycobacterium marinum TaxID=1781 RepID=UPI0021C4B7E3|nr:MFS transporter [Mycobacterium marinum]GJN94949.1 MFS transporter [Mycobacterium marinum]